MKDVNDFPNGLTFDIYGIKKCQLNRYPLLFVDKIFDVLPGVSAKGIKCFSYNEWFFPAHFEDQPSVPGFVQVETLVQTFIMTFLTLDEHKGRKTNFVSIDNVKFRRMIVPGEQLIIHAKLDSFRRGIAKGYAESFVDGEPACRADFIVTLPDVLNSFKPIEK
jgi:3-hydroxyacyl-[acyl-carrier-protein] dehydratase